MAKIFLMNLCKVTKIGFEGEIDSLELSLLVSKAPVSEHSEALLDRERRASLVRFRAAVARLGHEYEGFRPWDLEAYERALELIESGYKDEYIESLEERLNSTAPESG